MDPALLCRTVRSHGGFARASRFGLVAVSGADATDFLDTQLPLDIRALSPGQGRVTARLDRRGRIQCLVAVLPVADAHYLLTDRASVSFLRDDLERFHIREKVSVDVPDQVEVWDVAGPDWPDALRRVLGFPVSWEPFAWSSGEVEGQPVHVIAHPWTGGLGGHVVVPVAAAEALWGALQKAAPSCVELTPEVSEVLLMEGGRPSMEDLGDRALLAELGREEEMASFTKGCYLGQETVARVHSRGKVQRRLVGLVGDGLEPFPARALVSHDGATVGETGRSLWSPSLDRVIGFAWVKAWVSEPDTVVHVAQRGHLRAATVRALPFYQRPGAREEAERLRRRGMDAFGRDAFAEAVGHFEKAVLLHPGDVDAYEAMGVCYERMDNLEDAVRVMEELRDMAPEYPMVWTNLSRYYAAQGKIQEAEAAKGQAAYLNMKQAMGEAAAQEKAREQEEQEQARAGERLELFRQVLDLDPEDVVANFGLGKLYLDRGEFDRAAPLLRKAIERKRGYSMAYNHLATCLVALNRRDEALDVLHEGIRVAGKQGDLMPKQSMERRLAELEQHSQP